MIEKEFYIEGGDGTNLYGKSWQPNKNIRAVLIILHGLSDHINRYEHVASFFVDQHIAVTGIDQHGHGKSPGRRGHINGIDIARQNIHALLIETRKKFTDQPLFIFGHSMGGIMGFSYALTHQSKEIRGLIISSPWFKLAFEPPKWKRLLAAVLGWTLPFITLPIDIDPMELTHDAQKGREYLDDPLNHGRISARLYNSIRKDSSFAWENADQITYPALMMHGKEDRITSWDTTSRVADDSDKKIELKLWENQRHELHNENYRIDVFTYMLDWMNKRL